MIQLFHICVFCHHANVLPLREPDRSVLERKIGAHYETNCRKCKEAQIVPINRIRARPHRVVALILVGTMLLSLAAGWYIFETYGSDETSSTLRSMELFGLVLGIPFMFGLGFSYAAGRAANLFNRYRIQSD